ncbi:hypothetical protein Tco_1558894, partial [Tanacetum coccineum]
LPFKRVAQAVTVGNSEKRRYAGSAPYCNKCRLHHEGPCTVKCTNRKKVGHMAKECHYKSDCPKLKNHNHGNKGANNDARGRAYALRGGDDNPDSNVITGTFLLNNNYPYILFDFRADRSFVLTTFSALIDIPPTTLDVGYTIELADGRITEYDIIIRGCTLNLLDHPFSTDLMPVELGSFDAIIGDGSSEGSNSILSIISCTKTQNYIQRGCHVFVAQISAKKTEDKSEEKRLEDVSTSSTS